jgi:hypothetical protein
LRDQAFATFTHELNEPAFRPDRSRRLDGSPGSGDAIELEAIVSVCFAVQARHRIIGVAVRCAGGFRVFSSDSAYRKLEDRIFPNARAVVRCVARIGAPA